MTKRELTNAEYAATLRLLADFYETSDLPRQPNLVIYPWSKQGTIDIIKAIGGRWTKSFSGNSEFIHIYSARFPGLELSVGREEFCTRTVSYDCKPILSRDEERELGIEIAEVAAA